MNSAKHASPTLHAQLDAPLAGAKHPIQVMRCLRLKSCWPPASRLPTQCLASLPVCTLPHLLLSYPPEGCMLPTHKGLLAASKGSAGLPPVESPTALTMIQQAGLASTTEPCLAAQDGRVAAPVLRRACQLLTGSSPSQASNKPCSAKNLLCSTVGRRSCAADASIIHRRGLGRQPQARQSSTRQPQGLHNRHSDVAGPHAVLGD